MTEGNPLESFSRRKEGLAIGGRDGRNLEALLMESGVQVTGVASAMLRSPEFTFSTEALRVNVVRTQARDIVGDEWASTEEIMERATKLGLAICPPEVGAYYRLHFLIQKKSRYGEHSLTIAMNPIRVSPQGWVRRFKLVRYGDDYMLEGEPSKEESREGYVEKLSPLEEFLFLIPSKKT